MTILLVDDEPELLEIMEEYCQDLGVRMVPALSGAEALGILESESVDLVFSDLNMPRMNGLELLNQVRARDPQMPFVFWSGYWDRETVDEARAHGNVDVLDKPFQRCDFTRIIARRRGAHERTS